ncbi:long-chain fatty acid--CoA ligase [Neobacillus niacini]|uniref:acyl-CoA synthetase n=1 Tax=Neobacillus niacini TaxID=86668 RepID=UPI002FFE8F5E
MTTSTLNSSRYLLLGELIRKSAHQKPNHLAFVYGDQRVTYLDLENRSLHIAGWLQEKGIEIGEKVGIISKNNLAFIEVMFAAALSGGVSVPINFRLVAEEFVYIINNSDTKILFIEKEYEETIQSIRHKLPNVEQIVVIGEDKSQNMISYEDIFQIKTIFKPVGDFLTDEDDCMICYTSGTTGFPKGAVLSHKNLILNALNMLTDMRWKGYKHLMVTPLFHIAGIGYILLICLRGGTGYLHREFKPMDVLQVISQEKIEVVFLVPAMWNTITQIRNIHEFDRSSITACLLGAASSPIELKKRILHYFPNGGIHDAFGQTEMSPTTTVLSPEDALLKPDSVGKSVANVEIRVVDENMNDVPVGEIGEAIYRGPTLMKEYYKNPEETEEALKGGWFHSGDLIRMDDEGFVYVVGRKKDMIISGGENIYPAELESVLYKHEAIYEAAVIGVPDDQWGESVKAYVVLREGYLLTEEEVIQYCKKHLASYKKPKFVEFLDELPRNASGKILKRVLREEAKVKNLQ